MSKKAYLRAPLFLAAVLFALLILSGCGKEKRPTVAEGIEIENDALSPYTDAAVSLADEVTTDLLEYYYTSKNSSVPDADTLADRALRLRRITEEHLLAEEDYLAFLALLQTEGERLIDRVTGVSEDTVLDFAYLKAVYLSLTKIVGEKYLGDLTHSLSLFLYDVKYEDAMHLFHTTGNVNQKVKAAQYLADRTVFSENIDKTDTRVLLSTVLFFADLYVGGALNEGAMTLFSDEEILLFLQHLDFSELTVGRDGWLLLFDYAATVIGETKNTPYGAKLFWSAVKNKNYATGRTDAEALAERMTTLLALLSSMQKSLTAADVVLIKEGNGIGLFESLLSRLGEEDRAQFLSLCEWEPYRRGYETVAVQYFSDTYTAYAESVSTCTAEELLASVGTQNFRKTLEGFLASLSPAFSILITED